MTAGIEGNIPSSAWFNITWFLVAVPITGALTFARLFSACAAGPSAGFAGTLGRRRHRHDRQR